MDYEMGISLSEDEKDTFTKFKKQMKKNYGPEAADDHKLYRFLKAREFNITQAEIMLTNHIAWRKQYKLDTILEDHKLCEVHEKYFMIDVIGFDKQEYIVAYFNVGNTDLKGLMKSEKSSEFLKGFIYLVTKYEKFMLEHSKKVGKPVEKWSLIMDFDNFVISQALYKPVLNFIFEIFPIYDSNYPERLETAFIINASTMFFIIYNMVKPILSARTVNKIKIFGKDGWKTELLKKIDPDILPAFLGGTRTDSDGNPRCTDIITPGGLVPKRYYFRSSERRLRGKPGVNEYVLRRMDKIEILLEVDEPNSDIEWEIETENGDIAFGLFKRNSDDIKNQLQPIIPIQKADTHKQCQKGSFPCKIAGDYILMLDNTYSWLREKHVFCRTTVKSANE